MAARTADGRAFRILAIVDEYTRECLAMVVKRCITSQDVLDQLYMLFLVRGVPEHIRSDNGPEFTSKAVREWLSNLGVMALFIEPGSPWENGYVESFNGKLRDEFLNGELFNTLAEARIFIEWWEKEYNQVRPHSALGLGSDGNSGHQTFQAELVSEVEAPHDNRSKRRLTGRIIVTERSVTKL